MRVLWLAMVLALSACGSEVKLGEVCDDGVFSSSCADGLVCVQREACLIPEGCPKRCAKQCAADSDCPTGCTCPSTVFRTETGRLCSGTSC